MTVMGAFAVLTVLFSSGPIFEGPDEQEHYRYIQYLAETGELPDPGGQSVALGMYNPADVVRLPVLRLADDQPLPNGMILISR